MENGLLVPKTIEAHRKPFPSTRWRQAINAFLVDIWSGEADRRPILKIGDITILNDGNSSAYRLFDGNPCEVTIPRHLHDKMVLVDAEYIQIETGLARFVRNNRIRCIAITFEHERVTLWLVKGEKRGEILCGLHKRKFP